MPYQNPIRFPGLEPLASRSRLSAISFLILSLLGPRHVSQITSLPSKLG